MKTCCQREQSVCAFSDSEMTGRGGETKSEDLAGIARACASYTIFGGYTGEGEKKVKLEKYQERGRRSQGEGMKTR